MTKRRTRCKRKRNGKLLRLIAGITAATIFGMAVYMLILAKQGNNLVKPAGSENENGRSQSLKRGYLEPGCSNELPKVSESGETVVDEEVYLSGENGFDDAESIAAVYRDIYDVAVETPSGYPAVPGSAPALARGSGNQEETNTLNSLGTLRRIHIGQSSVHWMGTAFSMYRIR